MKYLYSLFIKIRQSTGLFYAANIILPFILMNTGENHGFLHQFVLTKKITPTP